MQRREAFRKVAELAEELNANGFGPTGLIVTMAAFGILSYSEDELAEEAEPLRKRWLKKAKLANDSREALNSEVSEFKGRFWPDFLDDDQ